jgi:hypothetical protein
LKQELDNIACRNTRLEASIWQGFVLTNLTIASNVKEVSIFLHYLFPQTGMSAQAKENGGRSLSRAGSYNHGTHLMVMMNGTAVVLPPFIWRHQGMMNGGCLRQKQGSH